MNPKYLFFIVLLYAAQSSASMSSPAVGISLEPTRLLSHWANTIRAIDVESADSPEAANGFVFPATARIILIDQSGEELDIGEIVFSGSSEPATGIRVEMNHDKFDDQFLSMRPFRCLTDPAEWFCYLPYPYELKRTITPENLTDLEYELLFIWKSPKDFGIDAWNGVYYKLEPNDDGTLSGKLLQGDLNVLANPPEPFSYPIDLYEFIPEGAKNRLYPELLIRP